MPTRKAPTKSAEPQVNKTTKRRAANKNTVSEVEPEEPKPGSSTNHRSKPTTAKRGLRKNNAAVIEEQPVEQLKELDIGNIGPSVKRTKVTKARKENEEDKENVSDKKTTARAKPMKQNVAKEEDQDVQVTQRATRSKPSKKPETENISDSGAKKKTKVETIWNKDKFSSSLKNANGKPSNFQITSWNVSGIKAWVKKGGLDIIKHGNPNILCLQKTKCSEDKLPEELKKIEGYKAYWCHSQNEGVGILSKVMPISVEYGVNSEQHDKESRCITAEFEKFYLVNVYVPRAGTNLDKLPQRLEWNKYFKEYVNSLNKRKPVIVCGDMNVAHTDIDIANPETNARKAGFTTAERKGMTEFLNEGYVDSFRKLYPDKMEAYTFWTYRANARAKNIGCRLDYFIVSGSFVKHVCDHIIHSDVFGSDHCPLSLYINI